MSTPDRSVWRPPLAALLYGLPFLAMATGQLASRAVFEDALASYVLLGRLVPAALVALPALEAFAAIGLLASGVLPRPAANAAALVGVAVAVGWSALALQAFARGATVENCGCFGAYLAQELRWWLLLEDAYQLLPALWAVRSVGRGRPLGGARRRSSLGGAEAQLASLAGRG